MPSGQNPGGDDRLGASIESNGVGAPNAVRRRKSDSKPYDFRRPDKFSKEHLRALQTLHETYCRLVGSTLSSYLRTVVRVNLESVDQVIYGEFIDLLPNPTTVHVLAMDPLPGRALLDINMNLAFSLIDRLLGGLGKPLLRIRELTEIEMALLQSLVTSMLEPYGEAWSHLEAITPRLLDVVLNPQYIQMALPGDSAALMRFQVQVGGQMHIINLCLPYATLEPLIGKLTPRTWFGAEHRTEQEEQLIEQQLLQVTVPVVVVLGRVQLELRELLALEVGDILMLDTRTQQPLDVVVENHRYCRGYPGLAGQHMAVRIVDIVAQGE